MCVIGVLLETKCALNVQSETRVDMKMSFEMVCNL